MTSIRFSLSLTAKFDLEVEQLDVKTDFLHGELDEGIYMYQPKGYVEVKRIWCPNCREVYMDSSRHQGNGTRDLIPLCCTMVLKQH
ncbi:hypothetical protein LIER_41997 [Lithospermum erythrorhizon]|uniref:Reverse transcriptase Ty1/copia-type domain-containing protein n=1 Tax=Lithospermum erythrorhizon TaxID=34254 RepID=A0AAV3RJ99_LITER